MEYRKTIVYFKIMVILSKDVALKQDCFATDVENEKHQFGDWLHLSSTIPRPL